LRSISHTSSKSHVFSGSSGAGVALGAIEFPNNSVTGVAVELENAELSRADTDVDVAFEMKELESTTVGVSTEEGELGCTDVESLGIVIDEEEEQEVDSAVLANVAVEEKVVVVVLAEANKLDTEDFPSSTDKGVSPGKKSLESWV
jgi:hypothetical protein